MRTHDVAARKCPKCHRVFSKVEHLRRHQRSHTGERPFKCKYCNRLYVRSDVLNRHIRQRHPAAQEGDAGTAVAAGRTDNMVDKPLDESSIPLDGEFHDGDTFNRRPPSGGNSPPECLTLQGHAIHDTENWYWNTTHIDGSPSLDIQYSQGLHGFLDDIHTPELTGDQHPSQPTPIPSSRPAFNPFGQHVDSSLDLEPSLCTSAVISPDVDWLDGLLLTPPASVENRLGSLQKNCISNEQFEKVRRLWPKCIGKLTPSPSPLCWDDILLHSEDNVFSSPSLKALGSFEPSASTGSPWTLTGACRDRLTQLMIRYSSPNGETDESYGGPPPCHGPGKSELPATDILDICLDLYFGNFHVHLPFIHPGTFKACDTPSILLFPMCLIGMMLFNKSASRKLITDYLLGAIRHCRDEISSPRIRHCRGPNFLTVLASACLVLFIAASTPEIAFGEQRQSLYGEALSLAKERGLFGSCSYNSGLIQEMKDDAITWCAWTRIQSAQRLISCLILADAYSAHMLGTSPVVSPRQVQMPLLCRDELFEAHTFYRWKTLLRDKDPWRMISFLRLDVQKFPSRLSGLGLQTALAVIWLHIIRWRHERDRRLEFVSGSLLPSHAILSNARTGVSGDACLGSYLTSVFHVTGAELKAGNTNSLILWHYLCLQVTTDLSVIEDAAGRSGPETAKVAVKGLRIWALSPGARRACLHAAQMFVLVSHHRQSEGLMLHSEMALFNAALVLGFYLFTAPDFKSSGRSSYDILKEVDWTQVGILGLVPQSSGGGILGSVSAAGVFIHDGGPVCFNGAEYSNPYGATRRSFMNIAFQLEGVGKWNFQEYCRVLRMIANTLFAPEDQYIVP